MKGYLLAQIEVTDWNRYRRYIHRTPEVIRKYDGRFLVRGGKPITLEGPTARHRVVLVEFPSVQKAQEFYYSPEYQEVRRLRHGAATGSLMAMEGVSTEEVADPEAPGSGLNI